MEFSRSLPILEGILNLSLNSHKEVHLYFKGKLLEIVCSAQLAETCIGIFVTTVFTVPFVISCLNIVRLNGCLTLTISILLPFDFVRMSYNVGIAKSVLFVKYDQYVTILCIVKKPKEAMLYMLNTANATY